MRVAQLAYRPKPAVPKRVRSAHRNPEENHMRLKYLLAVFLLLAITAFAGDVLPASGTWTGTNDAGNLAVTVTSSSTGNVIVVTQVYTSPEGVQTSTTMTCVLNSTGTAYGTPSGGTVEFDDVVNGNPKAYRYEIKDASGGQLDKGLVSR